MFKIVAETKLYPTEDRKKVSQALQAIVEGDVKLKEFGKEKYLYIEQKNYSALDKLYELVRKQRILDVARKTLRNGIIDNSTVFFLNKQVAFVEKINFSDVEGESPLGPIRIEITYSDIEKLIDWLTPYTENGSEVTLVSKFP